ncbi:MAG: DNA repair protein RadC [Bacilli bacterium]|nr:DNA repair protein RadC [Bacilli bacterium]
MTKIKDLPLLDRPIERLLNNGVTALSNEEVISILLKTGTKEKSVKELSQEILKEIKDIHDLKQLNIEKIIKIKGIGKTKAATLIAAIELGRRINKKIDTLNNVKITNSEQVFNYFKEIIGDKDQEYFYCLYLDNSKKVIKNKMLFLGTLNYSTVHPREIFKEAYLVGANSIICIHNHPTGNLKPSKNDIELTNNLINIGMLLGIKIDDHVIISKNSYFSFFENNLI